MTGTKLRRWLAAASVALAAAVTLSTAGCGSNDNGGVIKGGPTTTAAPSNGSGY